MIHDRTELFITPDLEGYSGTTVRMLGDADTSVMLGRVTLRGHVPADIAVVCFENVGISVYGADAFYKKVSTHLYAVRDGSPTGADDRADAIIGCRTAAIEAMAAYFAEAPARLAKVMKGWVSILEREVRRAHDQGYVRAKQDLRSWLQSPVVGGV